MHLATATLLAVVGQVAAGTVATSNVPGKAFDRIAIIFFENQDYDKAYGDCKQTCIIPKQSRDR